MKDSRFVATKRFSCFHTIERTRSFRFFICSPLRPRFFISFIFLTFLDLPKTLLKAIDSLSIIRVIDQFALPLAESLICLFNFKAHPKISHLIQLYLPVPSQVKHLNTWWSKKKLGHTYLLSLQFSTFTFSSP